MAASRRSDHLSTLWEARPPQTGTVLGGVPLPDGGKKERHYEVAWRLIEKRLTHAAHGRAGSLRDVRHSSFCTGTLQMVSLQNYREGTGRRGKTLGGGSSNSMRNLYKTTEKGQEGVAKHFVGAPRTVCGVFTKLSRRNRKAWQSTSWGLLEQYAENLWYRTVIGGARLLKEVKMGK